MGEPLDAHRKRQPAQHSDQTLTGMHNVLEKLRAIAGQTSFGARVPALAGSLPLASACGVAPAAEARRTLPPKGGTLTGTTAVEPKPSLVLAAKEKKIHDDGLVSVLKAR